MSINYKQKHLFQTEAWAAVQQALGKKIVNKQGSGWSYQAVIGPNPGRIGRFIKGVYLPYGPSFDSPKALKTALDDVSVLAKSEKADQIIVEPYSLGPNCQIEAVMNGYLRTKDRQPSLTLVSDLSKPWDEVLLTMSKTNRYQWKYLERDEISFKKTTETTEVAEFAKMMRQTGNRTGAGFPNLGYYQTIVSVLGPTNEAGIVYGFHKGQKLVGTLFVDDISAKRRYYLYAGSYDTMRSAKVALNAALVAFLQKDAQDQGLESMDYFGIAPSDAPSSHKWYGLSKFKRSLGGEDFVTHGTWEKDIKLTKTRLIKLLQKLV